MFTWNIERLDCTSDQNLVYTVHYCVRYTSNTDTGSGHVVARGTIGLNVDDSSEYVPYEELTEDLVLQWVRNVFGGEEEVSKLEQSFLQETNSSKTGLHTELPW
jgi:hypothetical protein